jgi:hypothetical protein
VRHGQEYHLHERIEILRRSIVLSHEENKTLEQLRQANQQHEQVPASQGTPET